MGERLMRIYRYLTGRDDASFCHRVTEALKDGWTLYGDPCLAFNGDSKEMICGQAITKVVEGVSYSRDMDLSKL